MFLFPPDTAATLPALIAQASSSSSFFGSTEIAALLAIIAAFIFAWLYGRKANHALKRAHIAEAEAELVRAEAEVTQAQAEVAQHTSGQAQEFAETLIESAAVMIIGIGEKGELRLFNHTAEKVTGYIGSELSAETWLDALFPGKEAAVSREAVRHLIGRKESSPVETLLTPRSGEPRQISWQARHVHYQDEALTLLFGVDLTERAEAEQERHELERRMLDMQKLESLGVLAGGIAHDFNNLLTAILGNAQLAKIKITNERAVQAYLIEIERTSLQAADLCKQMLAYSGQGKVEVRLLDLNRIIRDMSQLLRISVAKKVQLSFDLAHALPLIQGDASQIRQVLMNLIINASEAIGDNEGSIWVSTGVVHGAKHLFEAVTITGSPEERDYVFISIGDTGCGMNEETRARIFDPFYTTKFTGRGLGLAAVLGIVRSHDGTLELSTREGEGTTFTLLLPKAEVVGSAYPVTEELLEVSEWTGEGLMLVVDDEESVRNLVQDMLEGMKFHVITARDGKEAVDRFSENCDSITAVLLDVTMPVMSGLEAYEIIRGLRPDVPVLFMSGYMSEGELRDSIGVTDFIQKPFRIEHFQAKLKSMLVPPSSSITFDL